MSHPVFRQAYRCPPPPKRVPVNVVVADIIAPDGTAREIVVRTCHTALDANNTAHVLATCDLDALRCALNQDAEGIQGEAARLRADLEQLEHMASLASEDADVDGLADLRDAIRKTLSYKPEVAR